MYHLLNSKKICICIHKFLVINGYEIGDNEFYFDSDDEEDDNKTNLYKK